jgi:cytochrome b561
MCIFYCPTTIKKEYAMMLRNNQNRYGMIAVLLHWLVAVVVLGMFVLGLWMVELDYYDPWRKAAPDIHKAIGVLLFLTMLFRLVWRWSNPRPAPLENHTSRERKLASLAHILIYVLMFLTMIAGYFISTADGRSIDVFGLFQIPATISDLPEQEDVAGEIHEVLAFSMITLVVLHALAALKHHFIDRDNTLRRMSLFRSS